MSFLAHELQKNAKLLEKGAQKHIEEVLDFERLAHENSDSIKDLFITDSKINYETLYPWIKKYFGKDNIKFTAIDGTLFKTSILDASIFFAGSYESSGFINCSETDMVIDYIHNYTGKNGKNKGRGITSVLSLHVMETIEIDTQFDLDILHSDAGVQINEEVILDQSNIAESVMLFSEYFLAYMTLLESNSEPQILLLDRSITGDHSALIARTQKQVLWRKTVNLLGYQLKDSKARKFDENDFFWGRWFMADYFDPIRPYLKFRILKTFLQQKKALSQAELSQLLQIPRSLKNDLATELRFLERRNFISKQGKLFSLNPKYNNSWDRM